MGKHDDSVSSCSPNDKTTSIAWADVPVRPGFFEGSSTRIVPKRRLLVRRDWRHDRITGTGVRKSKGAKSERRRSETRDRMARSGGPDSAIGARDNVCVPNPFYFILYTLEFASFRGQLHHRLPSPG
jgi:hypothetical protein